MSTIHSIGIAGIQVAEAPDKIRTVLGSCVGIVLYDRTTRRGAMGHIILPSSADGTGDPGKFADTAIDLLHQKLLSTGGGGKIWAKIAGGARMFGPATQVGLGERNVRAVKDQLKERGIALLAEHVGGEKGRKMTVDLATGQVEVQFIGEPPTVI